MAVAIPIIGAVTALAGSAMSVASGMEQTNAQQEHAKYQASMAEYNAKVAEGNAQIAEDEGKRAKQAADEAATRKRQETSLLIGQQRAKQGASGAQVNIGSNLDTNLDFAERGELDALQLEEQGKWQDYNKRIDAQNHRNQAGVLQTQATNYSNQANQYSPLLSNGQTLLTGIKKTSTDFINLI